MAPTFIAPNVVYFFVSAIFLDANGVFVDASGAFPESEGIFQAARGAFVLVGAVVAPQVQAGFDMLRLVTVV